MNRLNPNLAAIVALTLLTVCSSFATDWSFVTNGQGSPHSIAADSSGMTIIASYSRGGYWITEDGGESWQPYNATISPSEIKATKSIQISDPDAQIRLVDAMFRSQSNYDTHTFDGGDTWASFDFDPYWPDEVPSPGSGFWAIPNQLPGRVYFACQMGFAYNDDWGTWWSVTDLSYLVNSLEGIFVHPECPDTVLVYGVWSDDDWPSDGPAGGIVGSVNGGESFTRRTPMEDMCEAARGTVYDITMLSNGDLIACTSWSMMNNEPYLHFLRSQDGGQTWWWYPYYGLPEFMHTSDIEAIPEVEGRIFVTSMFRGFVYRSDDYGVNWERVYDGLPVNPASVRTMYRNPFSGHLYLGLEGEGIYRSTDYGDSFELVPGPPVSVESEIVLDDDGVAQGMLAGEVYFAENGSSDFVEYTVPAEMGYDIDLMPFALPEGMLGIVQWKQSMTDLSKTSRIYTIDLPSGTWTTHPEHDLAMAHVLTYQYADQTMLVGYDGSFSNLFLSDDLGETWDTIVHDHGLHAMTQHRNRWYCLDATIDDIVYAWNLYGPWVETEFPEPEDLESLAQLCSLNDTLYVTTDDTLWALWPDDTWEERGDFDHWINGYDVVTTAEDTFLVAGYMMDSYACKVSYNMGWTWHNQDLQFPWPNQCQNVLDVTWDNQRQRLWFETGIGLAYLDFEETSVDEPWILKPTSSNLLTTFPNPFNASTTIRFTLDTREHVKLDVFDILGRHVATLADGLRPAGEQQLTFDAAQYPSGTYYLRCQHGTSTQERKLVLIK
ncbi:T9SS type A sorting domain-containing protein [bacterium]|nr:T9SS type A sorting domain-containing protein [bacterium]